MIDDKLLEKYRAYASTEEAFAVLFVKKYLDESRGYWVDIIDCEPYEKSDDRLHFRFVECGLYPRRMKPKYPPKSDYTVDGVFNEHNYYFVVRAITWETAHEDIEQQKSKKVKALRYKITGVSYDKNRNKGYFRDDAPPEIKALAKNINDRTSPLWDRAIEYANKPEFVYKIKSIEKVDK